MLKKISKSHLFNFGAIMLIAPHLFCCVLPAVSAILGLVAPVGHSGFHLIPHRFMPIIFIFSGVFILISASILFTKKCPCECSECSNEHKNHLWQKIFLGVSTLLYIIGFIVYIFE